ncbi:MAG: polyphosphate kinase 2 family protein [Xanthomonadales bacterium]|nr:polyphosphate kinase 2 family protein [Xanthomonadales bacterium]
MSGNGDWIPAPIEAAIEATDPTYRIPYEGGLEALPRQFTPPQPWDDAHKKTKKARRALRDLQTALHASGRFSVLTVFQALDAAGKDGAIREVFQGVNPAGLSVSSFKRPSTRELAHDFLWRTTLALPQDGQIGIFNRSYYEEVLVVRVHPEYLDAQYAGHPPDLQKLWPARYRAIREHELHLARSGTVVLKFWLDVSPARQARRFMERLDHPQKRWKFSSGDVEESRLRPAYDDAVLAMFNETSRPWAPWFCIPADERWYARSRIAEIIRAALAALPLDYQTRTEDLAESEADAFREELAQRMKGK